VYSDRARKERGFGRCLCVSIQE